MNTLEELIEQKKQIEQQIKELKNTSNMYGNAKLEMQHYCRGDEWHVAIKSIVDEPLGQSRWRSIITCKEKEDAIKCIDIVVRDLQKLRANLTGGSDYDTEGN